MTQQNYWIDSLWPTIAASGETLVNLPGTTSVTIPVGGTADRPSSPVNGMMRYNTDLADFEAYNGGWAILATIAGVTLSKLEDGDVNTQIFVENFTGVDDNTIAFTMGDNSGTYTMPASVLEWSTAGFGIETPTGNAGNAGVGFTVTTGDGNVAAAGGQLNLYAGAGGASGAGGDINITSGASGASAGDGGDLNLYAGGSTLGTGGSTSVVAGDGPAGGDIIIAAGDGSTTLGGSVTLTGGDSTSGIGGGININPGTSSAAAGAPIQLIAGAGAGAANPGGAISITGGEGDASNGLGGTASVVGGAGGTGSGGGGNVDILGGLPQLSGIGGDINVTAGYSLGVAAGGNVTITGGDAGTTAVGGAVTITAGVGGSVSGVGGSTAISAGDGGTGSTGGSLTLSSGDGDGIGYGGALTIIAGDGGAGGGAYGGAVSIVSGSGAAGAGAVGVTTPDVVGIPAGDITLTAGTGSPNGTIILETGGTARFTIEADGTLSALTASYEDLVTSTLDITNKQYVDDSINNASHPYDIHAYLGTSLAGAPAGTQVYRWTFPRAVTLGTGGHFAFCNPLLTASVAGATFDFVIASPGGTAPGASIGTMTFAVGSTAGVVAALGPVTLSAGDELILVYTTPDTGGTLAGVTIGLLANT